jgi:predicted HTH transcriptional regulator
MGQPAGTGGKPDLDALLAQEGACVEWKANVADIAEVVRTLSAFANDYGNEGGGWVICGVEERRDEHDFAVARKVGLDAERYHELRNKVVDWCRRYGEPVLDPKVDDVPVPDHPERRLLVFHVAASPRVHWVKDKQTGTRVWYRTDSHTREAPPDVIAALMCAKGESPPFLEEACAEAAVTDLDTMLLDEVLRPLELPRPAHEYLVPGARVAARTPPLVVQDAAGRAVPTRLAVLLGCLEPARFLRGASAILAVYDGTSKTAGHSQRFDLSGPLPRLIRDVIARLQANVGYDVDKSASVTEGSQNRPRYARRAIEEAVVNAFVHRDYASPDPVRIDVFADRIEIGNPGGLVRGLDGARLADGEVVPRWRNTSLVIFMIRLGLAQELGQGLTTIIEQSLQVTGRRPALSSHGDSFSVVLYASRSLLSMPRPADAGVIEAGRNGIFIITIGGDSIRPVAERSFAELGLSTDDVLIDFATAYIELQQWLEQAQRIRDEIARWVENPAYGTFHLFYRGPVVMAPLIGALVAPAKPLVMYHYEDGRYFPAFTLDRRFLRGASRSSGSA